MRRENFIRRPTIIFRKSLSATTRHDPLSLAKSAARKAPTCAASIDAPGLKEPSRARVKRPFDCDPFGHTSTGHRFSNAAISRASVVCSAWSAANSRCALRSPGVTPPGRLESRLVVPAARRASCSFGSMPEFGVHPAASRFAAASSGRCSRSCSVWMPLRPRACARCCGRAEHGSHRSFHS
jgi:hypothetical protein